MCGILGIISSKHEGIQEKVLKKCLDTIRHRGPDGEGYYYNKNLAFGHRRLSIIDLSDKASQPFISKDKRYALTYNGEIYNFREIKKTLVSKGYIFFTDSDTEVVLNSLIEWGEKALLKFNGMFALGFYDSKSGEVLLARDRYGVKPLYFSTFNGIFMFSSEQKAIYSHPEFNCALDHEGMLEYFTFQNFLSNKTLVQNVYMLEAGHILKLNISKINKSNIHQYWDFNFFGNENSISENDLVEELDFLFSQAVNRQLVSDVEVGSYLSGGMDSGSITAIASNMNPDFKSFTCGFDLSSASGLELNFDERKKAEFMSNKFKTEHYEIVLKAGDMERCLDKLSYHIEEPRVGQSYPNFYASKLSSKFVKVVLSGAGGDELFGGYPWRYFKGIEFKNFSDYIDTYYSYWQRLLPNKQLLQIFNPIKNNIEGVSTKDIFRNVFKGANISPKSKEDFFNLSLYFEAKTFLHGLFVIEDKISMAHSLETRVPFMDNDVVDFAMKCPAKFKVKDLSSPLNIDEIKTGVKDAHKIKKDADGKQILRKMMSKYIPSEIIDAPKQGFSAPDESWFKGESLDFVKKEILKSSAPIYDYLSYKESSKVISDHLQGKQNKRLFIWSMLSVNSFIKQIL